LANFSSKLFFSKEKFDQKKQKGIKRLNNKNKRKIFLFFWPKETLRSIL